MLRVRGLRRSFRDRSVAGGVVDALTGVDLDVAEGDFASVLGASGSGKTTLLRCIAGFEMPDTGSIELAGRTLVAPGLAGVRPHDRGVGIVPQEGALFPHLSVAQNIAFGLHARPRPERRARVEELLDLVGMVGLGARRPHELSGGQQQRVALARALAPAPSLILLDEPFSALDAKLRTELREEVRDLLRRVGSTVVLVTHDQAEAMTMADHLAVMRDGRVVAAGPPREVYGHPVDLPLARFLGTTTVLPGTVESDHGGTVTCALGRLPILDWDGRTGPCAVLVRPEDVAIEAPGSNPDPDRVVGSVRGLSFFGAEALVHVAVPGTTEQPAVRAPGHTDLRPGDEVCLSVIRPVCVYPPSDVVDATSTNAPVDGMADGTSRHTG